jgi:hypothetical protein
MNACSAVPFSTNSRSINAFFFWAIDKRIAQKVGLLIYRVDLQRSGYLYF